MGAKRWQWAEASIEQLATIDLNLRICCDWTLSCSPHDLAAREGRRDRTTQELYFERGLTRARWGESAHNADPPVLARAIHLIPLPFAFKADGSIDWEDRRWLDRCAFTAGLMHSAADLLGISITWGGSWDFYDPAHYEIAQPESRPPLRRAA